MRILINTDFLKSADKLVLWLLIHNQLPKNYSDFLWSETTDIKGSRREHLKYGLYQLLLDYDTSI